MNYMCLNLPELPGIITVIQSKAATIQDLGHAERHIVLDMMCHWRSTVFWNFGFENEELVAKKGRGTLIFLHVTKADTVSHKQWFLSQQSAPIQTLFIRSVMQNKTESWKTVEVSFTDDN